MHQRILLRALKDPFRVFSPEETFEQNRLGDNSGNLIFSHAAYKLLATSNTEITTRFRPKSYDPQKINETQDVFVVPLANAFRRSYVNGLRALTQVIEKLTIPVVVLGVGVQTDVHGDREYLRPIDDAVKAFCRAVLDRSHTIGVRGEVTEDYLRTLGFSAVEQIGCPSMFLHGDSLRIEKSKAALGPQDRVAMTISPYVSSMASVVANHHQKYPNLRYIPQDLQTLGTLLYGDARDSRGKVSPIPIHTSHPLFVEDKVRMFVDPSTWMDYLSGFDFNFGTRIHGTIAALLAGTPGFLFAHDSRTLELARYFDIPHRIMDGLPSDVDAADLYAEADYTALNEGHKARFETMIRFLTKHDLGNTFADGESAARFDQRVSQVSFPPAVQPLHTLTNDELQTRLQWLHDRHVETKKKKKTSRRHTTSLRTQVRDAMSSRIRQLFHR